jgi:hypothetical protein
MANALFTAYRNNILGLNTFTNVQLDADTIRAMFVDHADDTPVATTDDAIDDILSAARVPAIASCPTLGTITLGTVAAGVFDAADTTFTSLTGDQVESMILFKDTGVESTSILIAFFDTFSSGMPLTPNGGNVTVQWNASGIFQV